MGFNVCGVCGACDGRAGMLIQEGDRPACCQNCNDSFKQGAFVIHAHLRRTQEELERQGKALDAHLLQNDAENLMKELKGDKKDVQGKYLDLHQKVLCADQFQTTSGIQKLVFAKVVAFTDTHVRIRIEGHKNTVLRLPEQLCVIM